MDQNIHNQYKFRGNSGKNSQRQLRQSNNAVNANLEPSTSRGRDNSLIRIRSGNIEETNLRYDRSTEPSGFSEASTSRDGGNSFKRKRSNGNPYHEINRSHVNERKKCFKNWLKDYTSPEYKVDWFDNSMMPRRPDHSKSRGDNHNFSQHKPTTRRPMGFKKLEEVSQREPVKILEFFTDTRNFQEFESKEHKKDFIVLFLRCINGICQSEFHELKVKTLIQICKSQYMKHLRDFVLEVPYTKIEDKKDNMLFWNDLENCFTNLFNFCQTIIEMSPSTAMENLQAMINIIEKSIDSLQKLHKEKFSDEFLNRFANLQSKFVLIMEEEEKKAAIELNGEHSDVAKKQKEYDPPNDFREIAILPDKNELFYKPDYLRPNIVEGAYQSVEHYLDIQFRLLREDFIAPLRESIQDYLHCNKKSKRRYGSSRFYYNVSISNVCKCTEGMGVEIVFNQHAYKKFEPLIRNEKRHQDLKTKTNRLLYGSLLVLTSDNFETVTFCTVIENDDVAYGMVKARLGIENFTQQLFERKYIMVETDTYFIPYMHVLEALKANNLKKKFPLEKYIIKVENIHNPPKYLDLSGYTLHNGSHVVDGVFPSANDLGFDPSQYEAYKTGITKEFAIIQGPPGTGKTFVGLKIVKTLLKNIPSTSGPILIVCFTNHALDQFLENLMTVTDEIIRIGGQSKNENLKQFNLRNVKYGRTNQFHTCKDDVMKKLTSITKYRDMLNILNSSCDIMNFAHDIPFLNYKKFFKNFYYDNDFPSPFLNWLTGRDLLITIDKQKQPLTYTKEDNYKIDMEEFTNCNDYEEELDDVHRPRFDDYDDDIDLVPEYKVEAYNVDELLKTAINEENFISQMSTRDFKPSEIQKNWNINDFRFHMAYVLKERLNRGNKGYHKKTIDTNNSNASHFNMEERWALYWNWHHLVKQQYWMKIENASKEFTLAKNAFDELKQMIQLDCLKEADIVGVTTSGAARLQSLLRTLKPSIVVVEEAAEVKETDIIVSLTSHCQHLIMIGDHQQLRPKTASYRLAKHFNLDISLFERMVNNKNHCVQLSVQHRMRPEISKMITPSIYPTLYDHQSVMTYPNVRGVTKNLFFLHHTNPENQVEDSVSRMNEPEANFALSLAKYFIQQGYKPSEVTILAAYSGQMFYMRKQRMNIPLLRNVHIIVLDNYQGEENEIIILSLVRNNLENNIGFLSENNRVCVALSRAKQGFYILGNMDILQAKSELWRDVFNVLKDQNAVGEHIELQCQIHGVINLVKETSDFNKVVEGGCLTPCNRVMKCGHKCKKICHLVDMEHDNTKCDEQCERMCDLEHECKKLCYMPCECMVIVERVLKCGHKINLPCSEEYQDHLCHEIVEDTLPFCDHKVNHKCHINVKDIKCIEKCTDRLPCGHSCRRKCHKGPKNDPDHARYICHMPCESVNKSCKNNHKCHKPCYEECAECTVKVPKVLNCGHKTKASCYMETDDIVCVEPCERMLPCGHHCKMLCEEPCDSSKCKVYVSKLRPSCGHTVKGSCGTNAEKIMCAAPCERILSECGHICTRKCGEDCSTNKCNLLIENTKFKSICGHSFKIPCHFVKLDPEIASIEMIKYCEEPCNKILLGCEHLCVGTCGKCWAGQMHVPCGSPCGNSLVCGHLCEEPCRSVCPPCKKPCEFKCSHSKCNRKCGVPCQPCKEKCVKKCKHGKCNKLCSEDCSIPPCTEPCLQVMKCGHPCRGLCGEVCPTICNVCDPDTFPDILFGNEDDKDAKFLKLVDCSHIVEVTGMDQWMKPNPDEPIGIKCCPMCKSKVVDTPRYMEYVSKTLRHIHQIKLQIFGNKQVIIKKIKELDLIMHDLEHESYILNADRKWHSYFKDLHGKIIKYIRDSHKRNRHYIPNDIYLNIVKSYEANINILQNITDIFNHVRPYRCKPRDTSQKILQNIYVHSVLNALLAYIKLSSQKVSEQIAFDINNMLSKLRIFVFVLDVEMSLSTLSGHETTRNEIKTLKNDIVFDTKEYDDGKYNNFIETINKIRKLINITLLESEKEERKMIVAAMGFKQGHWYTCPNGHPYCIADCGGALVTSKCNECGANIGGTNHRLLESNRVATFMDGATHSAWPGNYNMADNGHL